MLVLSRKVGEKIVIDNRITITVTRISGGRVSVGIDAPAGIHIIRGELKPFDDSASAAGDKSQAALGSEHFETPHAHPAIDPLHQVGHTPHVAG